MNLPVASSRPVARMCVVLFGCVTLVSVASPGWAEVTEDDSIRAGIASALAAADYAREHCPRLRIDEAALDPTLARLDTSLDALREDPDYADQARAMSWVHENHRPEMACQGLSEMFNYRAEGLIRHR